MDYLEPIDEEHDLELDVESIGRIPINALKIFVEFLLPQKSRTTNHWRTATARLAVLAHALGVESIRAIPLSETAKELGCSRALLSLLSCELRDFADLAAHAGRCDTARESYARSASAVWTRRRERVAHSEGESVNASPRQSSAHPAAS